MLRKLPYGRPFIAILSVWKHTASLFIFILLISGGQSLAASGSSNSNGNWNNPSTWLFNGIPRTPLCGDSIFIPAGFTVTVNSQEDYSACTTPLYIEVSGILQFTNGNKLDLPCGSLVRINAGGLLRKVTSGGGNSTLISICGVVEWAAGDGDLNGPALLGDGPLPVSLLSFSAQANNEGTVNVTWSTASEINNSHFLVQRSQNSLTYSDILVVEGAGNSNTLLNYFVTDESPLAGINYYRLCQVDFDGTRTYYQPVAVRIGESANVLVYPNPATEVLWIEVPDDAQVIITDIYGKLVSDRFIQKGISSASLKNLQDGMYTVKIRSGEEIFVRKIVVHK
jgi:hypothetical protein